MERLTGRNEKGELLVNGKVVYAGDFYDAATALEEYEELEEKLQNTFGECDGLLEELVNSFFKHETAEVKEELKEAGKVRLLTDGEVDKWLQWKKLEEDEKLIELPCKHGDTVYELCKCDDGIYRIFPMTVKVVNPYGAIRKTKDGISELWNIYAESDYTYMYKSFYDIGKTVFLTDQEALEALEGMKE